ncbi:MAG: ATP-binding protein [Minisyncoccia bacterium]
MNIVIIVTIFTIVLNLYLGSAVVLRNPKSVTHQLFGFYTLLVALWAFSNYFTIYPSTPEVTLIFIRIVCVITSFLAPVLFLLSYNFPTDKLIIKPWLRFSVYLFAIGTAILSITPLIYDHIEIINGVIVPYFGPLFILYGLNVFGLPVLSFILLIRKFRKATNHRRLQILIFMLGVGITYALAEILSFIFILLKYTKLVFLGPFFTLILVVFVFYAITKYKFLDIKLLIFRSVTYILLIVTVALFYIFGLFIALRYIFPSIYISTDIYWLLFFLSFTIVIGFNSLYKGIESILGKLLFKTRYNPEDLVFKVVQTMATEVDFDMIAPKVLNTIMSTLNITKAAILVVEQHKIIDIKENGFGPDVFKSNLNLQALEDILHRSSVGDVLLFEEIEDEKLKEILRRIDIEVILPIRIENREVALMVYGQKSAGDTYTMGDLDVFKIIAKEIGESIESTRKFKMLKLLDIIRSDFVESVSHEFRTPLTESRWKLERLLKIEYGKPFDSEMKGNLSDIYFSVGWLVESLNKLIVASDLQISAPILHKKEINIHKLFNEEIFSKIREMGIWERNKLTLDVQDNLPLINIDVEKIKDAFSFILENAIKYSPENSEILIHITIREAPEGLSFLQVKIIDQGIGIDSKDIPHMFSKFYRGYDARITVPNGLGLGLFISKAIVELHGGKISVKSTKGKGATFFVELPFL